MYIKLNNKLLLLTIFELYRYKIVISPCAIKYVQYLFIGLHKSKTIQYSCNYYIVLAILENFSLVLVLLINMKSIIVLS